jgi:hypothetical protein
MNKKTATDRCMEPPPPPKFVRAPDAAPSAACRVALTYALRPLPLSVAFMV